jgi:hypothetical protein
MKTIKYSVSSLLLMAFVILAGCNENLTSPSFSHIEGPSVSRNESGDNTYTAKMSLQIGEAVWLNSKVTSLARINGYKISNCNSVSRNLFVSSSSVDGNQSLPCSWKSSNNFMLEDLVMENVSGRKITIEVNLSGTGVN